MPSVLSAINNDVSPFHAPVLRDLAAGDLLVVTVADDWSYGVTITDITDTQGNVYTLDVAGDTVTWVAHSLLAHALTTADALIVTFDTTPWTAALVAGQAFRGGVTDTVRAVGAVDVEFESMNAVLAGAQAGDLVVAFANFYQAVSLTNPGPPWTPFLNDVSVPSAEVTGDYLIATDASTLHYTPAPVTGGGYDEGVIVAFETTGPVTLLGGGGGSSIISAGSAETGIVGS